MRGTYDITGMVFHGAFYEVRQDMSEENKKPYMNIWVDKEQTKVVLVQNNGFDAVEIPITNCLDLASVLLGFAKRNQKP